MNKSDRNLAWTCDDYCLTTDPEKMDLAAITQYIVHGFYRGKTTTPEILLRAPDRSLPLPFMSALKGEVGATATGEGLFVVNKHSHQRATPRPRSLARPPRKRGEVVEQRDAGEGFSVTRAYCTNR